MESKLSKLLSKPARTREVQEYESIYDEFVGFAGGCRVNPAFLIPSGVKNADYWFELDQFEILLELKQLTRYDSSATAENYFLELLASGKLRGFDQLSDNKLMIGPHSLHREEWNQFYDRLRPSVGDKLKAAERQLRDTHSLIERTDKRRFRGVVFLNSGDFNLPTDLLFRIVEWKVKREWKQNLFRSIDFVSCVTVDMYGPEVHPLHSRHIARSAHDSDLVAAVRYLHEKWLTYTGSGYGLTVQSTYDSQHQDTSIVLQKPFSGKIVLRKQ